jgi:hypothetical protein
MAIFIKCSASHVVRVMKDWQGLTLSRFFIHHNRNMNNSVSHQITFNISINPNETNLMDNQQYLVNFSLDFKE